jgi:magnesium transporter
MITVIRSGDGHQFEVCDVDDLPRLLENGGTEECTIWVDLNEPTVEEEERILGEIFKFHPLTIQDCRHERSSSHRGEHLPKVEDYGRYLFVIINALETIPRHHEHRGSFHTRQINAYLGENFIVTHHYQPSPAIRQSAQLCERNALLLERGPDYIYHLILDTIVDEFTPILDRFDEEIEKLEDEVFNRLTDKTLPKILGMKRDVFRLRRISTYQREMVNRLSRGEFQLVSEKEIAYYRNVYDHLVRAAELSESYRDILTGILDAYLSMTSQKLNEIMKVLTLFSTYFLPLTFIAGIYGMNFDPDYSPFNMPELRWFLGYPFSLGLMLAVVVAMFIYIKRKKWL